MSQVCVHGFVSGRVQGVCFRSFVQREARRRELTGWVRNLPDGRVEVMLCGEQEVVAQIAELLAVGPQRARVEQVELAPCPVTALQGFSIR